jgi:putative IMPACT (imprinted ancient) family translation regulator
MSTTVGLQVEILQKKMSEYYSIGAPIEKTLKVKNSTFMALLCSVETREQAEARLAERRRQYHDATHHSLVMLFESDSASH